MTVTGYDVSLFLHITAVVIGLGSTFVLAGLIGAYFIPEDHRLEAMVRRDIAASGSDAVTLSDEYQRRVRIEAALGGFASLLVIAAVYLMVTKPGL